MRRARTATHKGQTRYRIVDAVSISDRPASIENRAVPDHGEGDLLCGARNSQVATLVERKPRFTMLVKLARRDALTVAKAMGKHIRSLPVKLRKSATFDRGPEFAARKNVQPRGQRQSLFLRSTKPLAARNQRKHKPSSSTVLPRRDGSVAVLSRRSQSDRAQAKPTPT